MTLLKKRRKRIRKREGHPPLLKGEGKKEGRYAHFHYSQGKGEGENPPYKKSLLPSSNHRKERGKEKRKTLSLTPLMEEKGGRRGHKEALYLIEGRGGEEENSSSP